MLNLAGSFWASEDNKLAESLLIGKQIIEDQTQRDVIELANCLVREDTGRYLYNFWGAPIGVKAKYSETYKQLLINVYDVLCGGLTVNKLTKILSILNTTATIYKLSPDLDCPHITIPKELFDNKIGSALTFINEEVELVCNNTGIRFEVFGDTAAVDQFFLLLNEKSGIQLKIALEGQDTVNPYKLLTKYFLTSNIALAVLGEPVEELIEVDQQALIKTLMPPHEILLTMRA